jgi:putative FmdB family regulatory protein
MYEYVCKKCENRFEKLVKSMSSSEKMACPKCGSKQTNRALSVFAVSSSQAAAAPSGECCPCGKNRGACSMN